MGAVKGGLRILVSGYNINLSNYYCTHRARQEHDGWEEGGGGGHGLDEDVHVAVNSQQPLDSVWHVEVGKF